MTERLMSMKFPKEKSVQSRYETYKKIINLHNQSVRYMRNIPPLPSPPIQIQKPELKIDENTITIPVSRDSNGDKVITLISSSNTQYSVVKDEDSNVKLILRKQ